MNKIVRILSGLIGLLVGLGIANTLLKLEYFVDYNHIYVYATSGIIFLSLFILFGYKAISFLRSIVKIIENEIATLDSKEVLLSTIGFTIAMLLALLISNIFKYVPFEWLGLILTIATYIILGFLGINIPKNYTVNIDILQYFSSKSEKIQIDNEKKLQGIGPKIIDTSVIIDGRITDIVDTGFLEGKLIVPEFILEELQQIADSSDDLKRKKGRRGLDILKTLQENTTIEVEVVDTDFPGIEVDIKLLKLAVELNGSVLTNDFNLNKVAAVQGVKVLNINELANAVKPIVLPGENFRVEVIQKGKGNHQGVGYLEDGTMIVVENGQKFIGKTINSVVTSVLQTDAGRMIFVKPE